jgi:hypothetical protein
VGVDEGTNVSSAYKSHESKFTGKINKVTLDVKPMTTAAAADAEKARRQAAARIEMSN